MKLNAYILYQRLGEIYPVKMYGTPSVKMTLLPPELYIDNNRCFSANHVYLATVENIPSRPQIETNTVLICIGENPRLAYYEEHAVVILIKKKVDFFNVYKSVQTIYEQFASWESELLNRLLHTSSIQDVLDCTYPVLRHSIFVLDSSFRFIAESCPTDDFYTQHRWDMSQGKLKAQSFLEFIETGSIDLDASMVKKGAFFIDLGISKTLCVNLFDLNDSYMGCLCIDQNDYPYVKGEEQIAEFLADIILHLLEANPTLLGRSQNSLKEILRALVNELPLSQNQKLILQSENLNETYICLSIHCTDQFTQLPISYLCSVLESFYPDGLFFEYNNTIVGLLKADCRESVSQIIETKPQMSSLVREMHLYVGISNSFSDFYMIRTYYLQAEAAIENGRIYGQSASVYSFSEFALCEMVLNAFGGFPMEVFYPEGFRRLIEHDKSADVSYLETLTVFLEENMSYSKTARRLYIHRSTLLERIERIEKDLALDLKNPEIRLQLMIFLKAREIEEQIINRNSPC